MLYQRKNPKAQDTAKRGQDKPKIRQDKAHGLHTCHGLTHHHLPADLR